MAKFFLTQFPSKPKPKGRLEKKIELGTSLGDGRILVRNQQGWLKFWKPTNQGVKVIVNFLNPFSASSRF